MPLWLNGGGGGGSGPAGPAGPSAYDSAVALGFVGTEAEWLESLEATASWADLGFYETTMIPGNTAIGAANAAALLADVTAAAGKTVVMPVKGAAGGLYTIAGGAATGATPAGPVGAVHFQDLTVRLWQLSGVELKAAPGASASTYLLMKFYNCDVETDGLFVNGDNIAELGLRVDACPSAVLRKTKIINIGYDNIDGILGTYGITCYANTSVKLHGIETYDFKSRKNATYNNSIGTCRHIFMFENAEWEVDGWRAHGIAGDDCDFFHTLEQRIPSQSNGHLRNVYIEYNEKTRRCWKFQGGNTLADNLNCEPHSSFVPTAPGAARNLMTGATQANPAVITAASHGYFNGQQVRFTSVGGMTELNGNVYTVANITTNTFELSGIDSTGFGAWTSGGEIRRVIQINAMTAANPAVITTTSAHSLYTGQKAVISGLVGPTALNGTTVTIGTVTSTTAVLLGVDGTALPAYVSGGELTRITDAGIENLNGLDFAGSQDGITRITNSRFDFTGFPFGISKAIGPLGVLKVDNCEIIGSVQRSIRNNMEPAYTPFDLQTVGIYSAPAEFGMDIRNCITKGWCRAVVAQGSNNIIKGNVIDDPCELAFEMGGSVTKDGLILEDNVVMTRTPGYLNISRVARIQIITNCHVFNNKLIRAGNTAHAVAFLDVSSASASGAHGGNIAPSGCIPFRDVGTFDGGGGHQGRALSPLVTHVQVGNVTTGEDALISQFLPGYALHKAGRALRGEAWGAIANNANAKTLKVYIGATLVLTMALTVSQAATFFARWRVISTGASAQDYYVDLMETGAVSQRLAAIGTLTENSVLAIQFRLTGEGVATGDIICHGQMLDSLEGTPLVAS